MMTLTLMGKWNDAYV